MKSVYKPHLTPYVWDGMTVEQRAAVRAFWAPRVMKAPDFNYVYWFDAAGHVTQASESRVGRELAVRLDTV